MSKHIKYKDNNICVDKYYFMSVDGCQVVVQALDGKHILVFEDKNISTYIHDVIYEFMNDEENETLDLDEILSERKRFHVSTKHKLTNYLINADSMLCKHTIKIFKLPNSNICVKRCLECGENLGNVKTPMETVPILTEEVKEEFLEIRRKYQKKHMEERKLLTQNAIEKNKEEFFELYNTYLNSDDWKEKRKKVLKRDNFICQACLENQATEVHHLTYSRVFNEPLFDLVSICTECHKKIHNK